MALAATLLTPSISDAQGDEDLRVSCTIHVFTETECEMVRREAVADMVSALESFASANGSYLVDGSGYLGRGSGWAFWEGRNYSVAIGAALVDEGHLASNPLWSGDSTVEGELLVYRCQDRVAVFTRKSTSEPSPGDRDWWANNGCTTYPITNLNATYFEVSVPLSLTGSEPRVSCTIHVFTETACEGVRREAVSEVVSALESFGSTNGTYLVEGSGYLGRGTGYAFWQGPNYPVAISTVLIDEGHLTPDPIWSDPLWSNTTSIEADLLVYRCLDRVAVFTRNSTSEPSPDDRSWWANNGCTTYPITGLNATYYELSTHLPAG